MKILQINSSVNTGSTGRIAEDIGKVLLKDGHQSFIAAGFTERPSTSQVIKIGNQWDQKLHGIKTRLFDRHGFGSKNATLKLVKELARIKPDLIHLHNLHGYYLHIDVLFAYLNKIQLPVVWTFHDCWPFTGHCSFFDRYQCTKWQTVCHHCPNTKGYPASLGIDNSLRNYQDKQYIFNWLDNCTIVTPSEWLAEHVHHSFLGNYPVKYIHNGIDLEVFSPTVSSESTLANYQINNTPFILGVASTWDLRKGLKDFEELALRKDKPFQVVLVGLSKNQLASLPTGVIGIARTENTAELAALYAAATVFVNPSYVDNFPTTNLEALACGTSVITYNTGGSPEAIDAETGIVVEKGDVSGLYEAIKLVCSKGKDFYTGKCRERAVRYFNKEDRYTEYLELYKSMHQR
ncbi:MAG TPA: glycosyltransferase [Prolixibacteraceae bacterium]|nr:glycosyltransferase [Prolixibacteraceae bacterium]